MDKDVVFEIQESLRTLSFFDPRLMNVSVDGIYTRQTAQAVLLFQSLYGLEPSGKVDTATWEELHDRVRDVRGIMPQPLEIFPHSAFLLRPNEENEVAVFIQQMLNILSAYYDNINTVSLSGVYDSPTVIEMQNIQRMHRIEPTGVIDSKTWNVLATMYNHRLDTAKR